MTKDELNALPAGTKFYNPTDWFVKDWLMSGRVGVTDYFTLTHPPDEEGVITNKRPVYMHALDLMHSTLDEPSAWLKVLEWMEERKQWIHKEKLPIHEPDQTPD